MKSIVSFSGRFDGDLGSKKKHRIMLTLSFMLGGGRGWAVGGGDCSVARLYISVRRSVRDRDMNHHGNRLALAKQGEAGATERVKRKRSSNNQNALSD